MASGMVSTARLTGQTIGGVSVAVIFGLMRVGIWAPGLVVGAGRLGRWILGGGVWDQLPAATGGR